MMASFSRLVMSLMDKSKPYDASLGLSRPELWSVDAIDLFTATTTQPKIESLRGHAFMTTRDQSTLVWLVPFVLISASHKRE